MLQDNTERAALLPVATILDESSDGRRENDPAVGPAIRRTCSLGSWKKGFGALLSVQEKLAQGVTAAPALRFLQNTPYLKKGKWEQKFQGEKTCLFMKSHKVLPSATEPWSLFKLLVSVWLLLFVLPTQPVPGREETWLVDRQCVFPSKKGVNWSWLQ